MPAWGSFSASVGSEPSQPRPLRRIYLKACRRLAYFESSRCKTSAILLFRVGWESENSPLRGEVKAIPLGCGSVFCPTCNRDKKNRFFRDRRLGRKGIMLTVTAHYYVKSAYETRQVIDEFYGYLRKFYRFRMSDLRRLRRLFFSELRRSNLSPKQRALQIKLFREFVGLLRNIKTALRKNGVKTKPDFWRLYNLLPGVGVVEVTAGKDPERGYWVHPHLHMFVGISGKCSAISVFPQVLLTAIWREVTGGKFFITHVKVIQSKKPSSISKVMLTLRWKVISPVSG